MHDDTLTCDSVPLDRDSPDEGLYTLVQTNTCRRQLLTEIYKNEKPRELFEHHLNVCLLTSRDRSHCSLLRYLQPRASQFDTTCETKVCYTSKTFEDGIAQHYGDGRTLRLAKKGVDPRF